MARPPFSPRLSALSDHLSRSRACQNARLCHGGGEQPISLLRADLFKPGRAGIPDSICAEQRAARRLKPNVRGVGDWSDAIPPYHWRHLGHTAGNRVSKLWSAWRRDRAKRTVGCRAEENAMTSV